MDQLDLNIHHYDFNDLMNVFKIKEYDRSIDYKIKLNRKVQTIKEQYPPKIADFYHKSKNILLVIFSLLDNKIIQKKEEIPSYVNKMKTMTNLESHNENQLLNELINLNDSAMTNDFQDSILNDTNILETNHLNQPNFNTHEGRINPNLNNKNNTNVIYNTFPNDLTPGTLNSVKRITQLLNLNLNSCFRSQYYQSNPCDFLYLLPSEIKNVVSMRLASIEIPNAWYLFSKMKRNHFFEIDLLVNDENFHYLISVPDGNYDVDSLQHYLNTTYFYQSELDCPLKMIQFSINRHTLKSSFKIIELDENDDKKIQFTLKFIEKNSQNPMNTMGWILGFRLGTYLNIFDCLYSEGLFDAGGDRYIYVCINDYQYNNNTSNVVCFDKSTLNEDVIAKIPMMNGKLSLVINDNNQVLAKIRRYNGPVNLSRLQIKILDKFGNVIDLNHMDFSFTLELEILYESFNFKNVTS